jgi:DNA repair protein RecO
MSHHIYHTRGIVIEAFDVKEANKTYWIFTRELGMIVAVAQGVRLAHSKLRFSLQPLSLCEISLVRGRAGWRVVNAREISNVYWKIKDLPYSVAMFSRVLRLVRRLVVGEEKNTDLFDRLSAGLVYVSNPADDAALSTNKVMNLEFILLLQVLYTLGYFAPPSELLWCINEPLTDEMVEGMSQYRSKALGIINSSIKETQL